MNLDLSKLYCIEYEDCAVVRYTYKDTCVICWKLCTYDSGGEPTTEIGRYTFFGDAIYAAENYKKPQQEASYITEYKTAKADGEEAMRNLANGSYSTIPSDLLAIAKFVEARIRAKTCRISTDPEIP